MIAPGLTIMARTVFQSAGAGPGVVPGRTAGPALAETPGSGSPPAGLGALAVGPGPRLAAAPATALPQPAQKRAAGPTGVPHCAYQRGQALMSYPPPRAGRQSRS